MTFKDKISKIIIYLLGIISLYIFIILRFDNDPLYLLDKNFLSESESLEYGDLYFVNLIKNFKIHLSAVKKNHNPSELQPDINKADILTFGDSFFADNPKFNSVPERLIDSLKKVVYFSQNGNPLVVLENNNYQKKDKIFLIFESCERFIPTAFIPKQKNLSKKTISLLPVIENIYPYNIESRYTYLMQRSFLTYDLYSALATFKFNAFGYINSVTPKYKKNPPWLFYQQEVDNNKTSFYYNFSNDEIKIICDNIETMDKQLKDTYNIDFIFLPVPNKYTIYHNIINNDKYNDFLPRIYTELRKRNVKVVELYDAYIESKRELYFPTDTHWNDEGINIAMSLLLKTIRESSN